MLKTRFEYLYVPYEAHTARLRELAISSSYNAGDTRSSGREYAMIVVAVVSISLSIVTNALRPRPPLNDAVGLLDDDREEWPPTPYGKA